jgi:hypothetical protein
MYASIPASAAVATPVAPSPSATGVPKPTSLYQATASVGNRVTPKFNPVIAKALVNGKTPGVLDGQSTIGGMGELALRLEKYSDYYVLGRISKLIDKEAPIPQRQRDWYPRLLTDEGKADLSSLLPRLSNLGRQFNDNERHALYASLLRSLGDPEESLTTAPVEGSPRHRIYNALFSLKTPCPDS